MATLLIISNSEGSLRCDAKCHEAQPTTPCECVCAGRYHAVGGQVAIERCRQDVRDGRYGAEMADIAKYLTEEATQAALF